MNVTQKRHAVALGIDANDALVGHALLGQLIGVQFVVADDPPQRFARHFDEFHGGGPFLLHIPNGIVVGRSGPPVNRPSPPARHSTG